MKNVGWRTAFRIYPIENLRKGIIRPLYFVMPVWLSIILSPLSYYDLIGIISELITTSFPSIIGFILAGYAILIGCSSSELITSLCKKDINKNSSLFQRTSATFAIVMGALIITLLIGFMTNIFFKSGCPFIFTTGEKLFNATIAFTISYMAIYSIWSLIDITINIFNFSQYINSSNQQHSSKKLEQQTSQK